MNGIDPREYIEDWSDSGLNLGMEKCVSFSAASRALDIQAEKYEAEIKGLHALINLQASRIRNLEANVPYTHEKCMRTHVQDCTRCDFIECGDNQSSDGQLVRKLEREIKRLKEGWMKDACQLIQGSKHCDDHQTEDCDEDLFFCPAVR